MNEETAFIDAILADPEDAASVQVYADWLEDKGDPRAKYLRLDLAAVGQEPKQMALRSQLDPAWLRMIDSRRFRIGDRVRIIAGDCAGVAATIVAMSPRSGSAAVTPHRFDGETAPVDVEFGNLRLLARRPPPPAPEALLRGARYREILERLLTEYASIPYSHGELQSQTVFDRTSDHYLVMVLGRDGDQRVDDCVIHLAIDAGQVWILHDQAGYAMGPELLAAGVPPEDIVLAFRLPDVAGQAPATMASVTQ